MRIAHLNICASGPVLNKPQATIHCYAKKKYDVICLTEIKISKKNQNFFIHKDYDTHLNLPPDHLQNSPREGVATLVRKDLNVSTKDITFPIQGRATHMKITVNNEIFECPCLYAPSQSDTVSFKFYEDLLSHLDTSNSENHIIIGDFNTTLDPKLDRKDNSIPYQKMKTSKFLNNYMLENSLVDPWRTNHPDRKEFSWANTRSASRIDYALISAHLYHHLTEANYSTPPVKTDHKAFTLGIRLGKFKTGKGYPKIRNTLYSDSQFVEKINLMIAQSLDTHSNHPAENILDLILFNTSTIATELLKKTKETQTSNLN